MANLSLRIGQVVFYLVRSEGKLKPIRVVEEVIRKTLNGTETVYMVQFPDQQGSLALDTLKGEVFTTPEEAYRVLSERSNAAIKRLVDGAINRARQHFPDATFVEHDDQAGIPFINENIMPVVSDAPGDLIEGPDGQMIRVRGIQLPESLK